jgi:hypothetical protein
MPKFNHKMGRPSAYSDEIAKAICDQLAEGKGLIQICRQEGFPDHKTVRGWVLDNHQDFFAKYTRSKDFGIDAMVEKTFEVIDEEEDVLRARLKVDTLKWYVSKIAPKKYGDKIGVEHSGSIDLGLADRISKARARNK